MTLKDDVEITSDDVLYDIFYGGYIVAKDILKEESDVKKVEGAIEILTEYLDAINEVNEEC